MKRGIHVENQKVLDMYFFIYAQKHILKVKTTPKAEVGRHTLSNISKTNGDR